MGHEPLISVGIIDGRPAVSGRFNGVYTVEGGHNLSGEFTARVEEGTIALSNGHHGKIIRSPVIRCSAGRDAFFHVSDVAIGIDFHWERKEEQAFLGNLIFRLRSDGTMALINEVNVEDYLASVVSSEMNSAAPKEFLKAHAIISRSWLLATLEKKGRKGHHHQTPAAMGKNEVVRWYDREDHDMYDVCADDHCQRYQGITKMMSGQAGEAVRQTRGIVIAFGDTICDARYSKSCGGLTENFATAWQDTCVPYLTSISDSPIPHRPIKSEDEAQLWIESHPIAYCNTADAHILEGILPTMDLETNDFFRWSVGYARQELEGILKEKSGFDMGTLQALIPLKRGPSGRISRLAVVGSKRRIVVGRELEIRRWLSPSHLYSSAFVVKTNRDSQGKIRGFVFQGAGWGHGVGLCQIGAAVMATKGFAAEEILLHYFPFTKLKRIY